VSCALERGWGSDWEEVREAFWWVRERVCRVWWRLWDEPAGPRGLFVLPVALDVVLVVVDDGLVRSYVTLLASDDVEVSHQQQ
jgi:hypothetical protein